MDSFFNALSAVATIIAAVAAVIGIRNANQIKKANQISIDITFCCIKFRKFIETRGHNISLEILNTSNTPTAISQIIFSAHGESFFETFAPALVALPYTPLRIEMKIYSGLKHLILDGRYNVSVIIKTTQKDISITLSEHEQRMIFREAESDADFGLSAFRQTCNIYD